MCYICTLLKGLLMMVTLAIGWLPIPHNYVQKQVLHLKQCIVCLLVCVCVSCWYCLKERLACHYCLEERVAWQFNCLVTTVPFHNTPSTIVHGFRKKQSNTFPLQHPIYELYIHSQTHFLRVNVLEEIHSLDNILPVKWCA